MWHCGDKRNACRTLMKKPEERRLLGRPRRRWEDGIKMDLEQDGRTWTRFVWLRVGINGRLLLTQGI